MRSQLVLAVIAATIVPCRAQPAAELPWMTGEQLVKLLGNVDPSTLDWTPDSPFPSRAVAASFRDMVNAELVHGYIQGIHDATEGKQWCWSTRRPKPHDLIEETTRAMQHMTDAQLKRSAAELIIEYWGRQHPCSTSPSRKK